jgi:hypothetical protein
MQTTAMVMFPTPLQTMRRCEVQRSGLALVGGCCNGDGAADVVCSTRMP